MARVKMFAAIPRKLGVSTDYFHDHWRHPHGTMGRLVPTLRRYIQSHRIHSDFLDDSQASFDGCAEVWFDNAQDALNFADEPYYVANIKPDELLFIDMPRLEYVFTQEEMLSTGDRNAELLGSMDGAGAPMIARSASN
ncbi:EthD domain-containing protein [Rhizorhabdus histidinilytica]